MINKLEMDRIKRRSMVPYRKSGGSPKDKKVSKVLIEAFKFIPILTIRCMVRIEQLVESHDRYASLTDSEYRAFRWLVDDVGMDIDHIDRPYKGPDFVYDDDLAIEVKSSKSYQISINQLLSLDNYDCYIFVVSRLNSDNGIYVDIVIDDFDMSLARKPEDIRSILEEVLGD